MLLFVLYGVVISVLMLLLQGKIASITLFYGHLAAKLHNFSVDLLKVVSLLFNCEALLLMCYGPIQLLSMGPYWSLMGVVFQL